MADCVLKARFIKYVIALAQEGWPKARVVKQLVYLPGSHMLALPPIPAKYPTTATSFSFSAIFSRHEVTLCVRDSCRRFLPAADTAATARVRQYHYDRTIARSSCGKWNL